MVSNLVTVQAKQYCPDTPVILCGLQADRRRDDPNQELVKVSDGYQCQREVSL